MLTGLTVRHFKDIPSILEVDCSGHTLPSDIKLLSMALLSSKYNVIASASLLNRECTTSSTFASCYFDDKDTRNTALRSLVLDLNEGDTREFGCEVNIQSSDGRSKIITWSLLGKRISKSFCLY